MLENLPAKPLTASLRSNLARARRAAPSLWFLVVAAALTGFAAWGMAAVPFHPDESTALYMSGDFEAWWSGPLALAWAPGQAVDLKTHYRLLDAPLSRQVIGLTRWLNGIPAAAQDWRWDQSWEWNRLAGGLPTSQALLAARKANIVLLFLSLLFIYLSGRRLGGEAVGLAAVLLLGLNSLTLVHARRAMMEGALVFGVCFALWSFFDARRRPWLVGLSLALAFNSKQSAVALLPVGLLAVAELPVFVERRLTGLRTTLWRWVQIMLVFCLVTAALNPVFWKQSAAALRAAIEMRQALSVRQVADIARLAPDKAIDGYAERTAAMLINLYIVPPTFAEYGNYAAQTAAAEQSYLAAPGHLFLRGLIGGALMLTLTLAGLAVSILRYRRIPPVGRRDLALAWLASAALAFGVVIFFSISWQRYVLPLVPLVSLWAAYPLAVFLPAGRTTEEQ